MNLSKIIDIVKHRKVEAMLRLFSLMTAPLVYLFLSPFIYLFFKLRYNIYFKYTSSSCKISNEDLLYISEKYIEAVNLSDNLSKAGGIWETIIQSDYKELNDFLINKDINGLSHSLRNFGSAPYTKGISLYGDVPLNINHKSDLLKRFILYQREYEDLSLSKNVSFPEDFGGIHCAVINQKLLHVSSFRHNYYAEKIMSLIGVEDGDIVEIGGGYGGLCYQLFNNFKFNGKYILIDMPIQLVNQAIFLMQALPQKKIVFINKHEDLSEMQSADILLILPEQFENYISVSKNVSVAFNAHSFTEMDFSVTEDYLKLFVKMNPKFILSFNHELQYEYKIGSKTKRHSSLLDKNIESILNKNYGLISRFPEILQGDSYWEYLWMKKD